MGNRTRTVGADGARLGLFGFILALHVGLIWLFSGALRFVPLPRVSAPGSVWIHMPELVPAPEKPGLKTKTGTSKRLQVPLPAMPPKTLTPIIPVVPVAPAEPGRTPAPIDFTAETRLGAAAVIAQMRRDAEPRRKMGAMPESPDRKAPTAPAYAWSRQPLSKHADFHNGVLTLNTKRCGVALLLIIPMGFGCGVGRLDPEPGRNDLFDSKYKPPELELPKAALPDVDMPP